MKALKILTATSLIATSLFAGITGSKHDLTSAGNEVKATDATKVNSEICVFCHTPHGSNSSFVGAPLWNKNDTTNLPTYTLYGATIAGTAQAASVSDSSKACLSCHDGVSAINSLVNAPGSGLSGTNATNLPGITVTGTGAAVTAQDSEAVMPAARITSIGRFGTDTDAAGVVNLTNDHPVSILYTDGRASLRPKAGAFGGTAADWTTPSGITNIVEVLRSNKIECASCHDPHLGTATTFLRTGTNAGSKLCIGCHDK